MTRAEYWGQYGLTPEGAEMAEAAMQAMLDAVDLAGDPVVARAVCEAAVFELFELPTRSDAFRKRMSWPGPGHDGDGAA